MSPDEVETLCDRPTLDRIREGVRILASRRLSDPVAAEETAQETMVRLIEALDRRSHDPPEDLGAFARGIAMHVIADTLRARGREVSLDVARGSMHLRNDDRADPLASLVTAEERRRVRQALQRLDPADRELLRLCFFEGRPPREIAALNGDPASRIRKRKSRALQRLRTIFLENRDPAHSGSAS